MMKHTNVCEREIKGLKTSSVSSLPLKQNIYRKATSDSDKISERWKETRWIKDFVTSESVSLCNFAAVTQFLRLAVSFSLHSRYLHTHSLHLSFLNPFHILLDFSSLCFILLLTHLSYNSIFTKHSCEPADPHLFCMMLFEDTLQLSLHSGRQGCTCARCGKARLNLCCSSFPMATEGRCRSVTMSTWLTLWPSLLQLSFQRPPIPHRRAEQSVRGRSPQGTESVCSKSLWADLEDPDSVLCEADSIVSVRHCQHSWLLCLVGTFWCPKANIRVWRYSTHPVVVLSIIRVSPVPV